MSELIVACCLNSLTLHLQHKGNGDFSILNESNIILPGVSESCVELLAVDDEIIEGSELFTVIVNAENPSDMVNGTTTIIILDNDGIPDASYCAVAVTVFYVLWCRY